MGRPIEASRWVLVLVAVLAPPVAALLQGLIVAVLVVVRGSNEPEAEIRGSCCMVAFALSSCPILIRCSAQLINGFETCWVLKMLRYQNVTFSFWQEIMKVFFPRFPWRVKRTTVIYICQDELPAVVLCGILSEGRQEAPEKKNGVGGSIWELVPWQRWNGTRVLHLYVVKWLDALRGSSPARCNNGT